MSAKLKLRLDPAYRITNKVTVNLLDKLEACGPQRDLFTQTLPKGAELTADNVKLAAKVGLQISFLANRVLEACTWTVYGQRCGKAEGLYDAAIARASDKHGEYSEAYRKAETAAWRKTKERRGLVFLAILSEIADARHARKAARAAKAAA